MHHYALPEDFFNGLLNDFEADEIPAFIRNAAYKGAIDYAPLKRRPFPHQDEGIRWILGLAERSFPAQAEQESHGALLADDMGLGKTYKIGRAHV